MISTSCAKEKFTAFLSSAESMNMLTKEKMFHILKPIKENLKICGIWKIASMRQSEFLTNSLVS